MKNLILVLSLVFVGLSGCSSYQNLAEGYARDGQSQADQAAASVFEFGVHQTCVAAEVGPVMSRFGSCAEFKSWADTCGYAAVASSMECK